MPDVVSFQEAIKATEDRNRALLIGNGFSIDYFSYHNLREAAELADDSPIKALFDGLGTVDYPFNGSKPPASSRSASANE